MKGRSGCTARYGKDLRDKLDEVAEQRHAKYTCPTCNRSKLVRSSKGIWQCNKCNLLIAGNTYSPW